MRDQMVPARGVSRSRWAALGAAVAVGLGGGGLAVTHATSGSGERDVFVPITPCRLFDTRPATQVGGRSTPIGPGETMVQAVTGTNGKCVLAGDATAVAMNVTSVNGTAGSFLTIWPSDTSLPLASSLNWAPGSPPTPNKVDVKLSATGTISLFNNAGTVDVLADVVGYYVDHNHDDRYFTKAEITTQLGAKSDTGHNHDDRYYTKTQLAQGPTDIGILQRVSKQQIALLRWDQDPARTGSFYGHFSPYMVAFDGTNIWVSNYASNTVSKINPVTGTSVDYTTGLQPIGVAFDGTHIWVANYGSNTVSKIDPNGVAPGPPINYTSGNGPLGIAFDGTNIWVANYFSNTVSKINTNGVAPGTPINYTTGTAPYGVAFDGSNIWVTNFLSNTVSQINPYGVAPGTPINWTTGTNPEGVAFDGTNIWVANASSNTVSKIDPTSFGAPGRPTDYATGINPHWVAFDGRNIWVSNSNGTVSKINPDGVAPGTPIDYATGSSPLGIAFDGTNIWVANFGSSSVLKIIP